MKYEGLKKKVSKIKEDDLLMSLLAGRIICIGEDLRDIKKAIDKALSHDQIKSVELLEIRLKHHEKEISEIRKLVEETITDKTFVIAMLDELLEEVSHA